MNKIGNITICVLFFMSTFTITYERQEQDGVIVTAHMFTDNQVEIVTRGIKRWEFRSLGKIFPIQVIIENKSQSNLLLNPRDLPLELDNTFNTASFMCMRNGHYSLRKASSFMYGIFSLCTLIATPFVQVAIHYNRMGWAASTTSVISGISLQSLLMAFSMAEEKAAEKLRDEIIADLYTANNPITINPGQVIKRIFYFVPPQEDSVTFYVTDQTNGKLLTFDFELE